MLYGPDSDSNAQDNHLNMGAAGLVGQRDRRVAGINDFVTRLSALLDAPHLVEIFSWMNYIPAR